MCRHCRTERIIIHEGHTFEKEITASMPDLNDIIEAFFALIIVLLLGYVFLLVFWQLSPLLSIFFGIVVAVVVIGILSQVLRRE